jgi:hypothetical protein
LQAGQFYRVYLQIMKKTIAFAAMIAAGLTGLGAIAAPNAQAQMNDNYAGAAANLFFASGGTSDLEVSIDGRYKIPASQFSARGSVYLTSGGGVQLTGTYDLPLGKKAGAYAGGGLYINDGTSLVLQVGAETKLSEKIALYGGVDYLTRFEIGVAKVGVGYSF